MRTNSTKSAEIKAANDLRKATIDKLLSLVVPSSGMAEDTVIAETEKVEQSLSVVGFKPWQEGFSASDLDFYIRNLKGRISYNRERIADILKADQDLIQNVGFRLQGLPARERDSHHVMRKHRGLLHQVRSRELFISRALGAIEVIEAEIEARKEREEAQRAEIAAKYAEREERNAKALKAQRRMDPNLRKKFRKAQPKVARSEMTLKGFGELLALKRKQGQFTTETALKKAEVAERLGGADQLATAFEEAKAKGTNVLHVFQDGRQIVTKKAGAVTRYYERA